MILTMNFDTRWLKISIPRLFIRSIHVYNDYIEIWGNYYYEDISNAIKGKSVNIMLYDTEIGYNEVVEILEKYLEDFARDNHIMTEKFFKNEDVREYETETHRIKIYFSRAIVYPDIIVMEIYPRQ